MHQYFILPSYLFSTMFKVK